MGDFALYFVDPEYLMYIFFNSSLNSMLINMFWGWRYFVNPRNHTYFGFASFNFIFYNINLWIDASLFVLCLSSLQSNNINSKLRFFVFHYCMIVPFLWLTINKSFLFNFYQSIFYGIFSQLFFFRMTLKH